MAQNVGYEQTEIVWSTDLLIDRYECTKLEIDGNESPTFEVLYQT